MFGGPTNINAVLTDTGVCAHIFKFGVNYSVNADVYRRKNTADKTDI